jgi:hypothetical protein
MKASAVFTLMAFAACVSSHPFSHSSKRSIAMPYILSCTTGMPAPMCTSLYGTTCDIDGDILDPAMYTQAHGDCSSMLDHCTCIAPSQAPPPCPIDSTCVLSATRLPLSASFQFWKPSSASLKTVTVTGTGTAVVMVTRTATVTLIPAVSTGDILSIVPVETSSEGSLWISLTP